MFSCLYVFAYTYWYLNFTCNPKRVRSFIVIICPGTVTELYQTVRKLLLTVPGLSEPLREK
jgi:hypothetical protein